ncbi:MAG: hypothetical protein WAR79_20695 [Melioribacteraceae bacterium]
MNVDNNNKLINELNFTFFCSDFNFVLIGFPVWKAYIKSSILDTSIEVIPEIDINLKTIKIPERHVEIKEKDKLDTSVNEKLNEIELKQIEDFFNLVPQDIIDLVKLFKDSHWETVKTIIQFGDKLKPIILTNPAIAYLVVNLEKFNSSYSIYSNIDYISRILQSKQKKILELALFPNSEQIVKIFSKLDAELLNFQNLIQLRKAIHYDQRNNSKVTKFLSHQELITTKCFNFIINNYHQYELLSHNAVKELLNCDNFDDNIDKLKKIKSYSRYLNLSFPLLKTIKNIDKVLETVKESELKRRAKEDKFPKPPIHGNEIIKPIVNKRELQYWSKRQVNCIRNFSSSIKRKQCYFYKVILNEEEATLQLYIQENKIKLGSLLATRNRPVSLELREVVFDWLKQKMIQKKYH